jgi:hypothetical protein
MDCPVCPKRDIEDGQLYCPNCKTDLAPLLRTRELPVLIFNQALSNLQVPNTNIEQVRRQLLFSIQLCPHLVEPRVVLGKLYAQQRDYLSALAQLWLAQTTDPANEKVQQCISAVAERLAGRDAQGLCLEADHRGKPVYLWSTLQFLDGNESFIWRLIPKETMELSYIVLRTGRIFPKLVILHSEKINEVDHEIVQVNLRRCDIRFLPQYQSDAALARTIKKALSTHSHFQAAERIGIQIEAKGGIVELSGNVSSEASREIAEEITRSVPGVVEIRNNICLDNGSELASAHSPLSRIDSARSFIRALLGKIPFLRKR